MSPEEIEELKRKLLATCHMVKLDEFVFCGHCNHRNLTNEGAMVPLTILPEAYALLPLCKQCQKMLHPPTRPGDSRGVIYPVRAEG